MQLTRDMVGAGAEEAGSGFREVRMILEAQARWLNAWHKHYQDTNGMGTEDDPEVPARVKLDDYWLTVAGGDGEGDVVGPRLRLDTFGRGSILVGARGPTQVAEEMQFWKWERLIVLDGVTPYWDEGGPATLTAWFERENYGEGQDSGEWELRAIMMEFDTVHNLIMTEGRLVWDGIDEDGAPTGSRESAARVDLEGPDLFDHTMGISHPMENGE